MASEGRSGGKTAAETVIDLITLILGREGGGVREVHTSSPWLYSCNMWYPYVVPVPLSLGSSNQVCHAEGRLLQSKYPVIVQHKWLQLLPNPECQIMGFVE